ncbi:MAG: hypothetical protein AB7I19_00630 [Planctomycetota bacterium]
MGSGEPSTFVPLRSDPEQGSVMVWALMFVVLTSGMIVSHSLRMASQRRELDARYDRKALAQTVGRAGVVDALAWFRGQPTQPVNAFDPVFDPYNDPPRLETIDPTLGLVREFEIRGNLWGRYELRREDVRDISAECGIAGQGKAWQLSMRSYVYRVVDPSKPFDQPPNRIVATDLTGSEFRGMQLNLPAQAPVVAQDPEKVWVGPNVWIDGGGGPGLAHGDGPIDMSDPSLPQPPPDDIDDVIGEDLDSDGDVDAFDLLPAMPVQVSLDPIIIDNTKLTGSPARVRLPSMVIDLSSILGMSLQDVASFADIIWDPTKQRTPTDTAGRVILVPGNLQLSNTRIDSAVTIVTGNLLAPVGSGPSSISGVMIVGGNTEILSAVSLEGVVVGAHQMRLGTISPLADPVVINANPLLVQKLQQVVQSYRASRTRR